MTTAQTFGQKLKAVREGWDFSRSDIAAFLKAVGLPRTRQMIIHYELDRSRPPIEVVGALADIFHITDEPDRLAWYELAAVPTATREKKRGNRISVGEAVKRLETVVG